MAKHKIPSDHLRTKRIYDPPAATDGVRLLVDRLWPRGVSKQAARLDEWLKDVAPSTELRHEFHGHPDEWAEFRRRYAMELKDHGDILARISAMAQKGPVTLLFAAKDEAHNNATALRDILLGQKSG